MEALRNIMRIIKARSGEIIDRWAAAFAQTDTDPELNSLIRRAKGAASRLMQSLTRLRRYKKLFELFNKD